MAEEEKNNEVKLPEGFRLVEDGETLPPGYETRVDLTLEKTITNAPKKEVAAMPAEKFPEPKVLEAVIDPNQKSKEVPTPFSFTSPRVIQQAQLQPTQGDVAKQEPTEKEKTDKEKLAALDSAIAREEKTGQEKSYSDYHDTAEMFVEAWEGGLQFVSMLIDKKGAPSAYAFLEDKKKQLIEQGTKVSRKKNWVVPIEFLFFSNLTAATARVIVKARDNRKEYMKNKHEDEKNNIPPETIKGGPNKGGERTRGPGRPRK